MLYALSNPDQLPASSSQYPQGYKRRRLDTKHVEVQSTEGLEGTIHGPTDLLFTPCSLHCVAEAAPNLWAAALLRLVKEDVEFDWGELWWKKNTFKPKVHDCFQKCECLSAQL